MNLVDLVNDIYDSGYRIMLWWHCFIFVNKKTKKKPEKLLKVWQAAQGFSCSY